MERYFGPRSSKEAVEAWFQQHRHQVTDRFIQYPEGVDVESKLVAPSPQQQQQHTTFLPHDEPFGSFLETVEWKLANEKDSLLDVPEDPTLPKSPIDIIDIMTDTSTLVSNPQHTSTTAETPKTPTTSAEHRHEEPVVVAPPPSKKNASNNNSSATIVPVTTKQQQLSFPVVDKKYATIQQPSAPKAQTIPKKISAFEEEAKWWFDTHARSGAPYFLACTRPMLKPIPHCKVCYDKKSIFGFRLFFYLKKLPNGRAVGDANICRKMVARGHSAPPFLHVTQHKNEEQCRAQAKIAFKNLWLITTYMDQTNHEEELVLWSDLVKENTEHASDLHNMMKDMFRAIAREDSKLCQFFIRTLRRALETQRPSS